MRINSERDPVLCGSFRWFMFATLATFFTFMICMMPNLLMGLMSIGPTELQILELIGTIIEKNQAGVVLPVFQIQRQLYLSLLFCYAIAMKFLPLCLDKLVNGYTSLIVDVLNFALVSQVVCCCFGLYLGTRFNWLIQIVMTMFYPIAYPIGKILDRVLGCSKVFYSRAQFKALVSIHKLEAGKGGELTNDETQIIGGALDLTMKTAQGAMIPIESTFALDIDSNIDGDALKKIEEDGHHGVLVFSGNTKNVVGLILVNSLLTISKDTPIGKLRFDKLRRIPADMPLYDLLKMFRKLRCDMVAVVKNKSNGSASTVVEEIVARSDGSNETAPLLENVLVHMTQSDVQYDDQLSCENVDGEVIGIITMEDIFTQLLQGDIVMRTLNLTLLNQTSKT